MTHNRLGFSRRRRITRTPPTLGRASYGNHERKIWRCSCLLNGRRTGLLWHCERMGCKIGWQYGDYEHRWCTSNSIKAQKASVNPIWRQESSEAVFHTRESSSIFCFWTRSSYQILRNPRQKIKMWIKIKKVKTVAVCDDYPASKKLPAQRGIRHPCSGQGRVSFEALLWFPS